jgi:hypothetical protein
MVCRAVIGQHENASRLPVIASARTIARCEVPSALAGAQDGRTAFAKGSGVRYPGDATPIDASPVPGRLEHQGVTTDYQDLVFTPMPAR